MPARDGRVRLFDTSAGDGWSMIAVPMIRIDATRGTRHSRGMAVVKTVEIEASQELVWQAIVDPAILKTWLGGIEVVTTWEVGGPIVHLRTTDARVYRDSGTVLEFEPPRRLRYSSWSPITRLRDEPGNRAYVAFDLEQTAIGTRVTLTHEAPPAEAAVEHANWFWRTTLAALKRVVEQRAPGP